MMMSSNGNIFHITSLLCGEYTGDQCIPHTKASDTEFDAFYPSALRAGGVLSSRAGGRTGGRAGGRAVGRAAAKLAEPISL